jgi:nucleoside-diphosphate-sugar epimerase
MTHTILGINGSTGIEIAKSLKAKGFTNIRGVSRRVFKGEWEHHAADVLNIDSLRVAAKGSQYLYCCVGLTYDIKVWQKDWLPLIQNVIQVAIENDAVLIFIDNIYMYGHVKGAITETTSMQPISKKGLVRKAVAEEILNAFKNRNLKGCIARAADFYGPDCPNSMLTETVIKNALAKKTIFWVGKTSKKHNFTYTEDIGKASVNLALDKNCYGQVWHLPTAKAIEGAQLISMIQDKAKSKVTTIQLRGFLLQIMAIFIPLLGELKEMMYQYDEDYEFDSQKYEAYFNHLPVSYEKGLDETLAFYQK